MTGTYSVLSSCWLMDHYYLLQQVRTAPYTLEKFGDATYHHDVLSWWCLSMHFKNTDFFSDAVAQRWASWDPD